jgi:ABC-type nickel/cobalt efflux system permease component RcnA
MTITITITITTTITITITIIAGSRRRPLYRERTQKTSGYAPYHSHYMHTHNHTHSHSHSNTYSDTCTHTHANPHRERQELETSLRETLSQMETLDKEQQRWKAKVSHSSDTRSDTVLTPF